MDSNLLHLLAAALLRGIWKISPPVYPADKFPRDSFKDRRMLIPLPQPKPDWYYNQSLPKPHKYKMGGEFGGDYNRQGRMVPVNPPAQEPFHIFMGGKTQSG